MRKQKQSPTRREMKMQTDMTREWITYKQAEEFSGLSRTTLWNLVGAGEIQAARVGRAVRINRASLDACLRRSSAPSAYQ